MYSLHVARTLRSLASPFVSRLHDQDCKNYPSQSMAYVRTHSPTNEPTKCSYHITFYDVTVLQAPAWQSMFVAQMEERFVISRTLNYIVDLMCKLY